MSHTVSPLPDQGVEVFGSVVPFGAVGSLVAFEDVRRAITAAETVEQVKGILAMAIGLAAAARQATDREMEAEAIALKFEAERRLGQLMEAQKKTVGFSKGGGDQRSDHRDSKKPGDPPTLAEAGIDKNLAAAARKAAAMPEPAFEAAKQAKREAALARTRLRTNSNPRKSRFDAEHYAFVLGVHIWPLAELSEEHPDRFEQVLDHILGDADSVDALAKLAQHPKIGAVLAAVAAKLGDGSLLAQPDADLAIENIDLRSEVEDLHGEIDALKARIAELEQAKPANARPLVDDLSIPDLLRQMRGRP